jgi:hypothetical protein
MTTEQSIDQRAIEFLESLTYSLEVSKFPSGEIFKSRAYLEKLENYFCPADTNQGLRDIAASGKPVLGFFNIANLVKVRGYFHIKNLDCHFRFADAITITLSGELVPDEMIDTESLLKITHLVDRSVTSNPYSIQIERISDPSKIPARLWMTSDREVWIGYLRGEPWQ